MNICVGVMEFVADTSDLFSSNFFIYGPLIGYLLSSNASVYAVFLNVLEKEEGTLGEKI